MPDDSSRQVSWYTILMQVHCTCTWYRYLVLQIVCLFRVPEDSSDWDVYSSRSKRHPCALCSVYRLFSLFDVKIRRNVDDGCGENRHNLQSGASSLAKHGGAYFSAVFGRKLNPTTVSRPCQPLACYWRVGIAAAPTLFTTSAKHHGSR